MFGPEPVGVAVSGAGRRKLHRHSAHLLRGGRGVCDERARAEFAGVLPRQPRAAGRYRRERVVFAGRAQPHFAELPRHSQGSCRRHLRRGDGKRRARVPVHFFSDSRRHCGPRDVVHNRDALYGGSEAGRAAIAGADVLRLFVGIPRADPARRTGREGDAPAIYAVRCFPVQFRRAGAAGQRCVWRHNHAGRHNVPACLRPAGNRHSRPRDVGQHLFAVCGHRDDRFRKRSALPVHASADGCDGG